MILNTLILQQKELQKVTLTLTGSGDTTYCYIQIDGIKYYNAETIETNSGTAVYCYSGSPLGMGQIVFNGTSVAGTSEEGNIDYTFTARTNTSINLTMSVKWSEIVIEES